jgi:membrane protease YdiL (CAAX protease family)
MEPVYVFEPPVKPSHSMLLGESIVDTLLALVIGLVLTLVIAVPVIALNFRSIMAAFDPPPEYVQKISCSAMPSNDEALRRWAIAQPGVKAVTVARQGNVVSLKYQIASGAEPVRNAPASTMGYSVLDARTSRQDLAMDADSLMARFAANPGLVGLMIGSLVASEAGFLLACAWGLRRVRAVGERVPAFFDGPLGKSIMFGAAMGVVALILGQAWSMLLERFVPRSVNIEGPMAIARDFPLWGKIAIGILGTVLAPLGEEYFFRGFLFGRYAAAGRVRLGIIMSSLFFAGVHLDPLNFVILFAMGLLMAWTYHRTGSLAASMTTHAVNNAVAFVVLFTTHHA